MSEHIPVLLNESVQGLNIKPEGVYVDATFGSGGHSNAILGKLQGGNLIAIDCDAKAEAESKKICDPHFRFRRGNFSEIRKLLESDGIHRTDGILCDLGVSSSQLDDPMRGFSFRFDANLDMRMDIRGNYDAASFLNEAGERELRETFKGFGEISNAGRLANEIFRARKMNAIMTTGNLLHVITPCIPSYNRNKYIARVFQSIRIRVNFEIDNLMTFLGCINDLLNPGGRLVIISYHSLEDRLVKNFLRSGNTEGKTEKDFYGNVRRYFIIHTKKPVTPSSSEISINNRSRSAKLRIGERI